MKGGGARPPECARHIGLDLRGAGWVPEPGHRGQEHRHVGTAARARATWKIRRTASAERRLCRARVGARARSLGKRRGLNCGIFYAKSTFEPWADFRRLPPTAREPGESRPDSAARARQSAGMNLPTCSSTKPLRGFLYLQGTVEQPGNDWPSGFEPHGDEIGAHARDLDEVWCHRAPRTTTRAHGAHFVQLRGLCADPGAELPPRRSPGASGRSLASLSFGPAQTAECSGGAQCHCGFRWRPRARYFTSLCPDVRPPVTFQLNQGAEIKTKKNNLRPSNCVGKPRNIMDATRMVSGGSGWLVTLMFLL